VPLQRREAETEMTGPRWMLRYVMAITHAHSTFKGEASRSFLFGWLIRQCHRVQGSRIGIQDTHGVFVLLVRLGQVAWG